VDRHALKWLLKTLVLLISLGHCQAQVTFRKIIGGYENDIGYAVLQKADSGYIIAGGTYMGGSNDFYLVQTDKYGDTLLVKRYGGGGSEIAYDIITATSGAGFLILGTTSSFGAGGGDVYLIKIDGLGDTLWTKTYGGSSNEWAWEIEKTSDGGYIFSGQTTSYGAGLNDVYVIKIDAMGDTIWTRTFGDSEGNATRSIIAVPSGGFIIPGGYLLRIDNDGNLIWSKNGLGKFLVPSENDYFVGGVWIVGNYSAVLLVQADSSANILWSYSYSISDCSIDIQAMDKTEDNGYIIAGELCATSILGEAFLMRIDSVGNVLWANIYKEWEQINPGEITKTAFYDVKSTSDGGFIAVGEASNFFTRDVYMVKTDANGNTGCSNDSAFFPVMNNATVIDSNVTVQVSTGGIVGGTSTLVTGTSTVESALCFDTITGIVQTREMPKENNSMAIFPNPARETLYFKNIPANKQMTLLITNLLGQMVQRDEITEPNINISNLPVGIYFLNLQTDDGFFKARFVKE